MTVSRFVAEAGDGLGLRAWRYRYCSDWNGFCRVVSSRSRQLQCTGDVTPCNHLEIRILILVVIIRHYDDATVESCGQAHAGRGKAFCFLHSVDAVG